MKIDNENVIKFLNKIENWIEIETLKTNTVFYEKDKAILTEIKGIVEKWSRLKYIDSIPPEEEERQDNIEFLADGIGVCPRCGSALGVFEEDYTDSTNVPIPKHQPQPVDEDLVKKAKEIYEEVMDCLFNEVPKQVIIEEIRKLLGER